LVWAVLGWFGLFWVWFRLFLDVFGVGLGCFGVGLDCFGVVLAVWAVWALWAWLRLVWGGYKQMCARCNGHQLPNGQF
jgi:hypothetical protein